MQRIARIAIENSECSSEKIALLESYNQLLPILRPYVSERTFSILAKPQLIEGKHAMGWYTKIEGQPVLITEMADKSEQKAAQKLLQERLLDLNAAIKQMPLTAEQRQLVNEWLPKIKSPDNPIYVINGDPVIINSFSLPILPPEPPAPAPIPPKSFWRGWRIALLGLFLLALLGLLWYLFCPWGKEKAPEPIAPAPMVENKKPELAPETKPEEPKPAEPKPDDPKPNDPKPAVPPESQSKNDPNCITQQELAANPNPSKMVMVFDNSYSMHLTLTKTAKEIEQYLYGDHSKLTPQQIAAYDKEMVRLPSRLTSSKQLAQESIDKIEPNIDIGLVTLTKCPAAETSPFYHYASRDGLKNKINNLNPLDKNSSTPLYSGIEQASKMLDGIKRDDAILVISDGEDTCSNQNICALAKKIAKQKPRLKINIVDIAGQHKIDCVANQTGGKVYIAQNPTEMIKQMDNAVSDLKINRPICK